MSTRGISSLLIAVIMALTVIAIIGLIAISMPLLKSSMDKVRWAGSMGAYKPPSPINSSSAVNSPQTDGYCLYYSNNGITYVSCPSIPINQTTTP
ncbi:hypothetical protein [Vulcanisaeta distributa]|uniref:Uncharacterized protein n=1 Tax=Vulcanisaeta distributa (strain DSM 14429 / JCM 11212 / NBRC 100878 / IC-017) TaxID=572478 RepID=E1QQE3_VULDI|nr:hypothetical protein [Vulcanisaeta distributa]ADN51630.1 hypothetical protein Vdis_2262 [Vulcanisaeta distributa DSM 14429]